MSGKKIVAWYLAFTMLVLGSMNLFVFLRALEKGHLLTAFILVITNGCVFLIGGIGVYKLKQQIEK